MNSRIQNLRLTWIVMGLCLLPLALLAPVWLGYPFGPAWHFSAEPLSNALDLASVMSVAAAGIAAVAVLVWVVRTQRFAFAILLWLWLAACSIEASRTGIWIS